MSIISQSLIDPALTGAERIRMMSPYDSIRLMDPCSSQPLKDSVLFVPCGHSVSHETAFKAFGIASQRLGLDGLPDMSVERPGACPACSHTIVTYVPNVTLRNLEKSLRQIQDLFTLSPLKNEVLLLPCGENVSETTARYYYGTLEEMHAQAPRACLACQRPIVNYVPNQTLRELEKLIHTVNQYKNVLLNPLLIYRDHKKTFPILPFPGKKAIFECLYPWGQSVNDPNGPIRTMMTFQSFNEDSFLMHTAIYEDQKRRRFVSITCRDTHISTFQRHLVHLGALENRDVFRGTFYAYLPHELTWALQFLTEHNTFLNENALEILVTLLQERGASRISTLEEELEEQEELETLTTIDLNSPKTLKTPISDPIHNPPVSNAFQRFLSSVYAGFASLQLHSLFPCISHRSKEPQSQPQREYEMKPLKNWRYNQYTRAVTRH